MPTGLFLCEFLGWLWATICVLTNIVYQRAALDITWSFGDTSGGCVRCQGRHCSFTTPGDFFCKCRAVYQYPPLQMEARLGKPSLVRETSRRSVYLRLCFQILSLIVSQYWMAGTISVPVASGIVRVFRAWSQQGTVQRCCVVKGD